MAQSDTLARQHPAGRRFAIPRSVWRLARDVRLVSGGIIILIVIIAALAAPLMPYDPYATNAMNILASPNQTFWMGTDELGRDIFSRVVHGAQISLRVGVLSVLLSMCFGIMLGMVSGYVGKLVDDIIMRLMDMILAFPAVILALGLVAALGPGLNNALIAIAVVNLPVFARLVRGQVLSVKHIEYVEAAQVLGQRHGRIMFRHILPNIMPPVIIQASIAFAFAILYEASLSFLGLGAQPPTPSWGTMLNIGKNYMEQAPWLAVFPGLAIFITVIGFNLVGDGIHDALDPRSRRA